MRILLFVLMMVTGFNLFGQEKVNKNKVFIRGYNEEGKKFAKGIFLATTDTTLLMERKGKSIPIPVRDIGKIKTKHSAGHNVLAGAAFVAAPAAILGAISADPDDFLGYTAGEGLMGGALIGGGIGAAIGGLTVLFKNSNTYEINGNLHKWKAFQEQLGSD